MVLKLDSTFFDVTNDLRNRHPLEQISLFNFPTFAHEKMLGKNVDQTHIGIADLVNCDHLNHTVLLFSLHLKIMIS